MTITLPLTRLTFFVGISCIRCVELQLVHCSGPFPLILGLQWYHSLVQFNTA